MVLSILIPTIRRHDRFLTHLKTELWGQMLAYPESIEIIIDSAEDDFIGTKRNRLLDKATGKYLCFFDSDDYPSADYIKHLMTAAESDPDCASLKGIITFDGISPATFEHSLKYNKWETVKGEITYLRYPNHLNMIRASIAKQFRFPEINHGEDKNWSDQIFQSGLLKTEFYIPEVIYYYRYISKKMHHV